MRRYTWLIAFLVLSPAMADAAAPLPLVAPPPDLTQLVERIETPFDKPRVDVPEVPLPAPPIELAPLPPAPVVLPVAERPVAYQMASRGYPCVGASLPFGTPLECGKDRFRKGEYAEAVRMLEAAVQRGGDRESIDEARYWLGESLVRLGQFEQADWTFRQIGGQPARTEWEVWAQHASGWTALRLRDPGRARDTFARLVAGALPASIQGWAQHGLALAHYALGEYAEADRIWIDLGRRGVPAPLAREYGFWVGEAAARVGDAARAERELTRFTQGGPHPLLQPALLRLAWAALSAGRAAESAAAFRAYLAGSGRTPVETDWAEGGLGLALARTGDGDRAREMARALLARRSTLAIPVSLELLRSALAARRVQDVQTLAQELLASNVPPSARAWLLLVKGDAYRLEGNRDEARTQYELANKTEPVSLFAQHALFRLARTNLEMREFAQAVSDAGALLATLQAPEMLAATLLLQGEAAYHASRYSVAEAAFRRMLVEYPSHPATPTVRLSLAWVALRQNQAAEARQLFLEFARLSPNHPSATDARILAAELALLGGDLETARGEFDRIVRSYPEHPRTEFAKLNLGILMVRQGRLREAQDMLRSWIVRAPFPPFLGRAHAALGAALLAANQPAEATRHFTAAQREGAGAFASLGLGVAAMVQGRAEEAVPALTEARDSGSAGIVAAAEYALAGLGLARGALREFKDPALGALRAAPAGPMAPRLLYVLAGIAAEEKDWPQALTHARTLVRDFPDDEAADDALERIGGAAAQAGAWAVVQESYSLMQQRYPSSPFAAGGRVRLGEAALQLGRPEDARRSLEQVAESAGTATADPRTWMLLGRAREQTGDRHGAIEAYARAEPGVNRDSAIELQFRQARLLMAELRWDHARAVLDRLLKNTDQSVVLEAAYSIGETYRNQGDLLAATEYYMTAGYLAPTTTWGREALLAAARSLAEGKDPDAASTVYRKLLTQADLPREFAEAVRHGLAGLGR